MSYLKLRSIASLALALLFVICSAFQGFVLCAHAQHTHLLAKESHPVPTKSQQTCACTHNHAHGHFHDHHIADDDHIDHELSVSADALQPIIYDISPDVIITDNQLAIIFNYHHCDEQTHQLNQAERAPPPQLLILEQLSSYVLLI